ncbi:hypothetical protein RYX36_025280 [Vicia faba]
MEKAEHMVSTFDSWLQVNVNWAVYILIFLFFFCIFFTVSLDEEVEPVAEDDDMLRESWTFDIWSSQGCGRAKIAQSDTRYAGGRDIRSYRYMFFVSRKV